MTLKDKEATLGTSPITPRCQTVAFGIDSRFGWAVQEHLQPVSNRLIHVQLPLDRAKHRLLASRLQVHCNRPSHHLIVVQLMAPNVKSWVAQVTSLDL